MIVTVDAARGNVYEGDVVESLRARTGPVAARTSERENGSHRGRAGDARRHACT